MTIQTATTHVQTPKATGYLGQLCNHFGHKISVDRSEDTAVFHFADGLVTAQADGNTLVFDAQAETSAQLEKIEQIIGSHLERFAFRENLTVTWP